MENEEVYKLDQTGEEIKILLQQIADGRINFSTEVPTSPNTDGGLKFVILSEDPQIKYYGYIYLILDSNS